jgi:hypothetical protein
MHTSSLPESAGDFEKDSHPSDRPCPHCGGRRVRYRVWESSCGGYEDEKYTCPDCQRSWWVEGPDS